MANTTNLNLVKPAGTDYALVSVINGNMDIIDSKVGAIPANESAQSQITALNNQIANVSGLITRKDCSVSIETFADAVESGNIQHFRMRNGEPSSSWNYSSGFVFAPSSSEKIVVMFSREADGIAMKTKWNGTWTGWKYVALNSI